MYSTWTDASGRPSARVSQRRVPEKEPSTQPLLLETTWSSTVSRLCSCSPLAVPQRALTSPCCTLLPGGNVHIHYQEEKCYDEEIFFYHLGCHQWVSSGERWPTSEFLLTVTSTEFSPICSLLTSFSLSLSPSLRRGRCKGALLACCCCHGGPGAAGGRGLQRRRPRRPGGVQSSSVCQQRSRRQGECKKAKQEDTTFQPLGGLQRLTEHPMLKVFCPVLLPGCCLR